MNKHFSIIQNRGVALILTILLMSLILFLSLYLLNFTLTEDRISRSQSWGAKTYYLAEAGIQEMVWKLKNDATYKNDFETNPAWTTSFTRTNPFGASNGSYTVSITNSSLAHGTITSTGTINIGSGKTSQRIVKTFVYRALGQSGVGNNCGYADGNIDLSASIVNFHDGSAHSNNVFIINGLSTVNIDEDLNAVGQYNKSWFSTVNVGGDIHSANYPPAAAPIAMPAVDFDSTDPNSLKNKATVVYTQSQFDTLMQNNQHLTLNGPITYVDGDIDLKGAQHLTVNGLLVVGRDLIVGHSWCRGLFRCGSNSITVNHTAGQAAGIMAKRKINFELWTGDITVTGIVYANDQLNLLSFPIGFDFDITGGLIGRKLTITSVWQAINVNYDNTILVEALSATEFSPVITVEHWEEEY
jgi:Tfp pilus assembly protein PilX